MPQSRRSERQDEMDLSTYLVQLHLGRNRLLLWNYRERGHGHCASLRSLAYVASRRGVLEDAMNEAHAISFGRTTTHSGPFSGPNNGLLSNSFLRDGTHSAVSQAFPAWLFSKGPSAGSRNSKPWTTPLRETHEIDDLCQIPN